MPPPSSRSFLMPPPSPRSFLMPPLSSRSSPHIFGSTWPTTPPHLVFSACRRMGHPITFVLHLTSHTFCLQACGRPLHLLHLPSHAFPLPAGVWPTPSPPAPPLPHLSSACRGMGDPFTSSHTFPLPAGAWATPSPPSTRAPRWTPISSTRSWDTSTGRLS